MFLSMMLSLLISCDGPNEAAPVYPAVVEGVPQAGAADGHLEMPIGVPLGCYTARCKCLGSFSYQDRRQGPYNTGFDESTGIHTRPNLKAIWLENGDQDLVLIKWDACMSNDEMVVEVTKRLEEATGKYLEGKVTLSASHTHSGYGGYNDQWHWYLGTDRHNEEVFRRMADQIAGVAIDAWSARQEAKIGLGWSKDWDPEGKVYSDRRGDNNDLVVWEDQEDWETGKDPHLAILKIDAMDDTPIAMAMIFGMHGIIMDADNPMVSTDSAGGLEGVIEEQFDSPVVVMHLQGAGGDASPRGSDRDFARMETIGEYARTGIMDLYEATPTAADPISLEVASRHIWEHRSQIHVTRNGTEDWSYPPLEDPYTWHADNIVYNEDGSLGTFDEFNAEFGAVFCGEDVPLIPGGGLGQVTEEFPYEGCVLLESISPIVSASFGYTLDDIDLPFKEDYKAGTTTTLIGPITTLTEEGEVVSRPLMMGFFPGEPVALYAEQWRRRVKAELGYEHPVIVGYSQDHEGYLLIPEDWMRGGYEPSISVWGPLQGEHIMERTLEYSAEFLGNGLNDDPDPYGYYAPPTYNDYELPTTHTVNTDDNDVPIVLFPDHTPDAGTRIHTTHDKFWIPKFMRVDLDDDDIDDPPPVDVFPAQLARVGGLLQFAWEGGDPMVDPPYVLLEHEVGGEWESVRTKSGRPITEAMADILVGYTPDPLFPHSADQKHYYWAAWQAVGHVNDRMGLPLGNYRFRVDGRKYIGNSETWPWDSEPYEMVTESFELVPATVQLEESTDGVWAWVDAHALGFRLADIDGNSRGRNPIRGTISVDVDGTVTDIDVSDIVDGRAKILVDVSAATAISVTDAYGNTGSLTL